MEQIQGHWTLNAKMEDFGTHDFEDFFATLGTAITWSTRFGGGTALGGEQGTGQECKTVMLFPPPTCLMHRATS